jgi:hypothetical protein
METEDEAPQRLANFWFAAKWAGGITSLCLIVGQGAEQYAAALPPTQPAANIVASRAHTKPSGVDPKSIGAIRAPSDPRASDLAGSGEPSSNARQNTSRIGLAN